MIIRKLGLALIIGVAYIAGFLRNDMRPTLNFIMLFSLMTSALTLYT